MSAPRNNQAGNRGIALLAALIALVMVGGMATVMFTTVNTEMQQAETHRAVTTVTSLAESGTISAERAILRAVANTLPVPTVGKLNLDGHTVDYEIEAVGGSVTETDPFGIQTQLQSYVITATASAEGYTKEIHRVVDVGLTPIFQFAIFYDKDLELLPGPSMTLSGRVHTNQDLYAGVGGSKTLTIASNYFRSVGDIFRRRKDSGATTGGTVSIQVNGDATYENLFSQSEFAALGVPSTSGLDSDFLGHDSNGDGIFDPDDGDWDTFKMAAIDRWNGTVQTGEHGVTRIEPPAIGSIKEFEKIGAKKGDHKYNSNTGEYYYVGPNKGRFRKGYFHRNADLVIRDGKAYDANGVEQVMMQFALSEKTMFDRRQGTTVTVTEIDIDELNARGFPSNGLIYASRSDTTEAQANGIRLVNGDELGGPLTVASEDPVYVQGDYNTINKKPAAVIADAVNLLSNSWDDSKAAGNLPAATETWYNFAMITGGGETEGSDYSGGFENLPRFHENWSGITAHILGSFVKIYGSEFATGDWVYGSDYYTAPKRAWDYDLDFNNAGSLPPFTPNVAEIKSVGWWE